MAVALSELIQRDDRRMVQPGGRLRRAQHPLGARVLDLLDGDGALKPLVEGAVDGAHPPGAESLLDPKPPHYRLVRHFRPAFGMGKPFPASATGSAVILGPARVESSSADDPFAPPRRRRPASRRSSTGSPPPPKRPSGDLFKRRLIAFAIGAGVVVLLLFAIRGCLDARKERNFENYLRDLSALVTTSNQLSSEFFNRLSDPGEASETQFTDQLGSSRGTGEDLLRRAEGLDSPDELNQAQEDLVLAFELRRDGLSSIVEQIPVALGNEDRQDAFTQIAADMRQFLASDVLY